MSFFSTRRTRQRLKQAEFVAQRSTANIAAFEASQLAKLVDDKRAAARSPVELAEAESRSSAQRQRSTPAV
jgi:hypothetical protein